jgi:hypothetical protein
MGVAMRRVLVPILGMIVPVLGTGLHADTRLFARIETAITFVVQSDQLLADYRMDGNELAPFLPKYLEAARKQDVSVYVVPLLKDTQRLLGLAACPITIGGTRACVILLDSGSSTNGQLATLLHELAHVESPRFKTAGEAEVFAETVAFLVLDRLGYDNRRVSMSYLWNLGPTARYKTLTEQEESILKLSERLAKVGKA